MECLRLRVQDIDFARNEITVRDGKGNKDRLTMLPSRVKQLLALHLERVKEIHKRDSADGYGRVLMPYAMGDSFNHEKSLMNRAWKDLLLPLLKYRKAILFRWCRWRPKRRSAMAFNGFYAGQHKTPRSERVEV